jgi:very-short-patch-repair endonuclease
MEENLKKKTANLLSGYLEERRKDGRLAKHIERLAAMSRGKSKPQHSKLMKQVMKGKNIESTKRLWQDENYAKNWAQKCGLKPNKLEKSFMIFLGEEAPNEWRYVGDGSVWIAGKNPDFIHKVERRVIELFGSYWHKKEEEKERVSHFEKYGFECIIVWDKQFKDWKQSLGYVF